MLSIARRPSGANVTHSSAFLYNWDMTLPHLDQYEAILARRSVRRYDRQPLDEVTLDRVRGIISTPQPLISDNQFHALVYDAPTGADLAKDLGGYGRVVNPPHYVLPYVLGQEHQLEDAGYRVQQIAVRLASLGIGSCFIGAVRREAEVRALYDLPEIARIGAFLVFGRPSDALGGRVTNQLLRLASGASRKLLASDIFFEEDFDNPALSPDHITPLIEAARHAPSAVNAQPWRFLWHNERLHIFVTRRNGRYGRGLQEQYRLHDGGAAMANITLAMEALDLRGHWEMLEEAEPRVPKHPPNLQPMATLVLDEEG